MLVNIIQNTISSFISAGVAAAEVITTNLKMWLGFETSETLGREEVVNGDFASNTWWTVETPDAEISNGKVNFNTAKTNYGIFRANLLTTGKQYKVVFTIDSYTSGAVHLNIGGVVVNSYNSEDTFTAYITGGGSNVFGIQSDNGGAILSINNVSVKELTQITPDKSGNNNVGELFTGKALEFNGSTEYVDVDGFQMSGNTATFSFWINPTTIGSNNKHIIDIDPNRFIIGFNNSQLSLYSAPSWHNFGSISTDVYQKVSIVINNTNVKCYVNGIQLGVDKTITAIDLSSATKFKICSHYLAASNFVDCKLSNLQIYNSVWSTDDIAYDYANPNKLAIDNPSTDLVVTNLKGYWALSEGDGKLAYDSSGEYNNGAIIGADYVDAQPRIPQLGMQNWSKGSNLFPYSEDFTEWIINSGTSQAVLAASEAAPYGQGDVYSIIMQASESDAYIRYATTNATLTSSTHSVWVKQAPTGSASHIRITNNNRAAWNTGTSQKIALTSSWQRLETTDAITGNRFTIIGSADASGTQDSDCIGKALIYGAQLIEGSSAGVYRFTDGAETSNSIVIANPTIPTQDIFGNAVRDRLNSFNLDGSGYAEVADDADLDFGTGAFSFDGWAKYAFVNQGSSLNTIYTHLEDSANTSAGFSLNTETGGKISAWFGGVELELSAGLSEGDWFYFALTRDASGNVKLYASTDLENPATTTQNPILTITNAANKRVGGDATSIPNNGFSRHYHNLISDVRLYDAELSASEIENNYNAGLSAHTN